MRRLGIFVFFDKDGVVDRYVDTMLEDVACNVYRLIIVCNGNLNEDGYKILSKYSNDIFKRENIGYDAGAYKDAILDYAGIDEIRNYDELLLLNDTFYGPFYPFERIFMKMSTSLADVWGLTMHQAFEWKGKNRNRHIQSYFVVIRKAVLESEIFSKYWRELNYPKNKEAAIENFELEFSQLMAENGFSLEAIYDKNGDGGIDESLLKPHDLIKNYKLPIIKRNSLLQLDYMADEGIAILAYIKQNYGYDITLIYESLSRHCSYEGILGYILHKEEEYRIKENELINKINHLQALVYKYKNRIDSIRWNMNDKEKKIKSIIIWGMGKVFHNEINYIDIGNVVAIVDNQQYKNTHDWNGIPVIPDTRLSEYNFKKIVVFTTKYYAEISKKLFYEYNIQAKDVVSWAFYSYYREQENEWMCRGSLDILIDFIVQRKFDNFDDGFNRLIDYGFVTKAGNWQVKYIFACMPYENAVYDNLYNSARSNSEVVLYIDPFTKYSPKAFIDKVVMKTNHKYIVFNVPIVGFSAYEGWEEYDFEHLGEVEYCSYKFGKIVFLKKKNIHFNDLDVSIYVVMHKKYKMPLLDNFYKFIQAGAELGADLGYLRDNVGENISRLNPYINEYTAIYWIWKSDRNSKFIGINHYRRYFDNGSGNIISQNEITDYLQQYDILVSERNISYPRTVADVMKEYVDANAFDEGYRLITEMIKKKCPEYLDTFFDVMNGYAFYACNMFVTSKAIFREYCAWVFNIIIDACEEFKIEQFDEYSRRMIGFFAERLFTVWIMKQHYKIKELPILLLE